MKQGRRQMRRVWGPGALAVISCALALMVSQPVGGAAVRTGNSAVAVAGCEGMLVEGGGVVHGNRDYVEIKGERKTFLATARRLHVLATFEILQRLLTFELRPVEKQMAVGMGIAPLELCLFERVEAGSDCIRVEEVRGISRERAFVMARCLLAPPAA